MIEGFCFLKSTAGLDMPSFRNDGGGDDDDDDDDDEEDNSYDSDDDLYLSCDM
jgi:hypothetical protein